jgi:hypothetical protein
MASILAFTSEAEFRYLSTPQTAPTAGSIRGGLAMRFPAILLVASALILAATSSASLAEDFRIETKVFVGKSKLISQNLTLFRAGYVYDYLNSGSTRVAVFDQRNGRFVILDPTRKVKAEVKTDDIRNLMADLHDVAAKSSNPSMKFAADPSFDVEFSEEGELTLASQFMTYKLKTVAAPSTTAAEQYREFSDWYARFNTMANPGSTPQFPRLTVNAELAKRGVVPTDVQLSTRAYSAHSEHYVTWRLLDSDHKRIAETANQLATFEDVEFEKLLEAPAE